MPDTDEDRFLTVARLLRAHGNRGELVGELESDDAGIFELFPNVRLWNGAGLRQAARIRETWPHQNRLIFKFDGIDTISQAEQFAGWQVQIPAELRPEAPPGRYYLADLVGCRVLEARSGRLLGTVRNVQPTGAVPLLEVDAGGHEILVPFASAICVEIDTARRAIRVDLPEGLEELNRA